MIHFVALLAGRQAGRWPRRFLKKGESYVL